MTGIRLLRQLGRRSRRCHAAIHGQGSFVVVHRFEIPVVSEYTQIVRAAACLERNWHPNVTRIRHREEADGELLVATELVDGITLEDLLREGTLRPEVGLRIFLDVLAGLHALHALREGVSDLLGTFHGELSPANVIVGKDGVARIANVLRPKPVTVGDTSEALGYAAPEMLTGDVGQDLRADLFAVGVMMWELLMDGQRLYADRSAARIERRQREEDIPLPAGPLGKLTLAALAFDPRSRPRSANEMATEIRAQAPLVAPGSQVAQLVADRGGARIRARRIELEALAEHDVPWVEPTAPKSSAPTLDARSLERLREASRPPSSAGTPPATEPSRESDALEPRAAIFADPTPVAPVVGVPQPISSAEALEIDDLLEEEQGEQDEDPIDEARELEEALDVARSIVVSPASVPPPPEPSAPEQTELREAFALARDIVVSPRSVAPPPMPAPSSAPSANAIPEAFPSVAGLTSALGVSTVAAPAGAEVEEAVGVPSSTPPFYAWPTAPSEKSEANAASSAEGTARSSAPPSRGSAVARRSERDPETEGRPGRGPGLRIAIGLLGIVALAVVLLVAGAAVLAPTRRDAVPAEAAPPSAASPSPSIVAPKREVSVPASARSSDPP